jgi:hypothetical protein
VCSAAAGASDHHACDGFGTFAHARSVVWRGAVNGWEFMRPPYGELVQTIAKLVVG